MITSTYICHLGNPDIWKNSTCWFYFQTVCYSRKKFSRDLGSPGSLQLLQLQLFPKIFKILDPPFKFYPACICFGLLNIVVLCYKFGSFEVELRYIVYHFQKLNDYLCFTWTWSFWFVDSFLFRCRKFIEQWIGAIVLYSATVAESN